MSQEVSNIEPVEVWKNFVLLNQVPRPSKKEERVIEFLISFAKKNNLEYKQDEIGNLVITKEATLDMTACETVVLQSHVDMVHEKNNEVEFDFLNSGIKMYVEGDWVKASGTTLGADNGLGVAAIMAVLESKEISHPKIEALFTIDEETGMTGALNLSDSILSGKIFLRAVNSMDDEVRVSRRVTIPGSKLRGFESGKIGPIDGTEFIGGNYGTAINLNTTLPNVLSGYENIDVSLFLDAANLWHVDYDSSLDSNKLRSATGVAVNWYTLIGPLTFSYAVPLAEASTDKTESFRFRIGTSF